MGLKFAQLFLVEKLCKMMVDDEIDWDDIWDFNSLIGCDHLA